MLGGVSILKDWDEMFVLEVFKRFKGGVVPLATDKIVGMIYGMKDLEGIGKGARSINNILTDGLCIDQCAFLLGKLLSASLDGLVEFEDFASQCDGALPNMLQSCDRIEKFLVLGKTNSFNIGFAILGITAKTLR